MLVNRYIYDRHGLPLINYIINSWESDLVYISMKHL
ncbi:DUF6688 family protein [Clostridium peptidivorans]